MNAQRRVTTPPYRMVEVVTSSLRPERLDEIAFTSQSTGSVSFGRRFGPGFAETSARETPWTSALPIFEGSSSYAPSLSVSFVIRCDSQQEIDEYWSKLTDGGSESQCGWLKDKFGLSWQVVPANISETSAVTEV
jgi:3-demethylubiquinone-9 3-methyltransferase